MACEFCSAQEDVRSAVRLQNRALRNVNRLLRRRQRDVQSDVDSAVIALLEENEQLREKIITLEKALEAKHLVG